MPSLEAMRSHRIGVTSVFPVEYSGYNIRDRFEGRWTGDNIKTNPSLSSQGDMTASRAVVVIGQRR